MARSLGSQSDKRASWRQWALLQLLPICVLSLKTCRRHFKSGLARSLGSTYFTTTPLTVFVSAARRPLVPKLGRSLGTSPLFVEMGVLDGEGEVVLDMFFAINRKKQNTTVSTRISSLSCVFCVSVGASVGVGVRSRVECRRENQVSGTREIEGLNRWCQTICQPKRGWGFPPRLGRTRQQSSCRIVIT